MVTGLANLKRGVGTLTKWVNEFEILCEINVYHSPRADM